MTQDDLDRIESELDTELSTAYCEFMLKYPKALIGTDGEHYELFSAPAPIIDFNREVRAAPGIDWPEEYLVIGWSGCGDYYALDLDDEHSSVFLWNHEIGDFDESEESDSIEVHAAEVIALHRRLSR